MNGEQKRNYELVNNSLWLLLKSEANDEKKYKTVLSDMFNLYLKLDNTFNDSDEWWDSTASLYALPEKYKGCSVCSFAADLGDCIYNYFKLKSKRNINNLDFYIQVSPAFIHEWERLKSEKENKKASTR